MRYNGKRQNTLQCITFNLDKDPKINGYKTFIVMLMGFTHLLL